MKRKKEEEPEIVYELIDLPSKHIYADRPRKRIITHTGIVIGEMEYIDPKPYWRSVGYMDQSEDPDRCAKYIVSRWRRSNKGKSALAKKESELDY